MRAFYHSFKQYLKEISQDYMLLFMLIAPLIIGALIMFIVPRLVGETYYLLADTVTILMTPLIYSFIGAMVILDEIDSNISMHLSITPLGKKGYLISRLGLPTALSVIAGTLVSYIFSISLMPILFCFIYTFLFSIISLTICMLVVSISSNRVEGMAAAKLSNILILGFLLPYIYNSDLIQYLGAFLPSFWAGKIIFNQGYLNFLPFTFVSVLWIVVLYNRFNRKIV